MGRRRDGARVSIPPRAPVGNPALRRALAENDGCARVPQHNGHRWSTEERRTLPNRRRLGLCRPGHSEMMECQ